MEGRHTAEAVRTAAEEVVRTVAEEAVVRIVAAAGVGIHPVRLPEEDILVPEMVVVVGRPARSKCQSIVFMILFVCSLNPARNGEDEHIQVLGCRRDFAGSQMVGQSQRAKTVHRVGSVRIAEVGRMRMEALDTNSGRGKSSQRVSVNEAAEVQA